MMFNLRGRRQDNFVVITCCTFFLLVAVLPQAEGVWEPPVRNTTNKVDLLWCPLRPECDLMICAALCSRQCSTSPVYFVYSVTDSRGFSFFFFEAVRAVEMWMVDKLGLKASSRCLN